MAGKVFFSVTMSLDGFVAPESMDGILATPEQRKQDPRLERWMAQWMERDPCPRPGGWRPGRQSAACGLGQLYRVPI